MITTDLTGNLGDHLVRYLITRMVADKNGYEWGINPVVSHDYYGGRAQMNFLEVDYGLHVYTTYGHMPPYVTRVWEEKRVYQGNNTYHPFQKDIFDIADWTKLIIYCGQDARYYDLEKVKGWLTIKPEAVESSKNALKSILLELDENICVINTRGGEYRGIASLFLNREYYQNAMQAMLKENPRMKFICVTDDPQYFSTIFPFGVYHFGIAEDYYIVNHAKNLILSNSGFALFPAWTNSNAQKVILPKYWSRYNASDGYWGNCDIWTFAKDHPWQFMDRKANLFTYEDITNE